MKKITTTLLCLVLIMSLVGCNSNKSEGLEVLALQQHDPTWADYVPAGMTESVGPTACGMFSIINGVHYLTGMNMDIYKLVDYASLDGSFTDEGTYRYLCYNEGGTLEKYFKENPDIKVKISKYWGGGACGAAGLDEYLDKGNVCIIHIKGHFMCIAARDEETNKYFVLDSAANSTRGTSAYGTWLKAEAFDVGAVCGIDDGFCALEATETPITHDNLPNPNYDYSVNIEIGSGKGKATFDSTGTSILQGTEGDVATYTVKPGLGYKVSSIIINGKYISVKNDGKEATYEYEIGYSDATINVYFSK